MKKFSKVLTVCTIFIVLIILVFPVQDVKATTINLGWEFPAGYTLNDGGVGSPAIFFNVTDSSFAGNGVVDSIPVTLTSLNSSGSIRDSITMTLHEINNPNPAPFGRSPDPNSGVFGIKNIVFNPDNARFSVGQTIKITQQDASKTGSGSITVIAKSSTDASGISLTLQETGISTGIFTGKLSLDPSSSVTNKSIHVSQGDILTINYNGMLSNAVIAPSPNGDINGLKADVGDTIRISYQGKTANTTICICGGGGGGGGGLIRPGLVLDIIAGLVGGSSYIVQPPSFGGLGYHFSDGLTFTQGNNKTIHNISHYNQELPRQVMIPGAMVNMTFKTYEGYNSEGVIHMGLYLIPRGQDMITPNSIASIEWNKGKPVMTSDPNHILSNVNASSSSDGKFQYTKFVFTPTKSYDKMSFLVRAWNDHRYSTDTRVHDAIDVQQIINSTLPFGTTRYDSFADLQSELHQDKFYNPEILSRIHDTSSVFPSQQGKVYWLYDTVNHFVTLVISDGNDNQLFSHKSPLQPYDIEKKGDYKFMRFTVKQLDRWDTDQIQKALKSEEEKALSVAIEKKIMPQSNW